jgi:hypothetical protein
MRNSIAAFGPIRGQSGENQGALAVAHPTESLSNDGVPSERADNFLFFGSLILNTL